MTDASFICLVISQIALSVALWQSMKISGPNVTITLPEQPSVGDRYEIRIPSWAKTVVVTNLQGGGGGSNG